LRTNLLGGKMTAVTYDFVIEQGTTLQKIFIWKDSEGSAIDLTGYTARLQIRPTIRSDNVYLDATTENGFLQIDAANGKVTLTVSSTATSAFDWATGVYDLELEDSSGVVTRLSQGAVKVSFGVTR
jgi:hypothetical protein